MTTGLMEWGQAGSYNAPDDRRVISALIAGRSPGVVKAATLTAGSGLNVNVAAGWLAVVDCGDGTNGVVGTASALTVPGSAGDAGAPRTDSLWCDINPTNGTFALVIIPQTAETGRQGIRLATITVPTAANLASAFTFAPVPVTFGVRPVAYYAQASGALNNMTATADVPGAVVNFTTTVPSMVLVQVVLDGQIATAGTGALTCYVNFDGADQAGGTAVQSASSTGRFSVSNQYLYTNVAAGAHTAKLRSGWTSTAGGASVRATSSTISVLVIPLN